MKGTHWISAAAGTLVGAAVALLFAPKAGKEVRADLSAGAQRTIEKTQEKATVISEHAVEWAEKVKETAVSASHKLEAMCKKKEEPSTPEVAAADDAESSTTSS